MKEEIEKTEALEMMKLGFDELCFKFYINNPETLASDEIFRFRGIEEDIRRKNSHFFDSKEIITAPLYQQAFRWFREKHNIHYKVEPTIKDRYELFWAKIGWVYNGLFNSYEEAELACLKKLIEIVKNK
jgi:hypothetical protein